MIDKLIENEQFEEALEKLQGKFDITPERRRELMSLIYDERDLRERATRVLKD